MTPSGSVGEIRRCRGLDVILLVLAVLVLGALTTSVAVAIEVSSPDAPGVVDVSTVGTPRIRIGDPQRTVRGLHRYILTYTLDGVVRGGRLAWNVVGTSWQARSQTSRCT